MNKIYIEDLLDNFQHEESGCKIGTLTVNAIACADDIALMSHTKEEMQNLVIIVTITTTYFNHSKVLLFQSNLLKERHERYTNLTK